MQRLIKSMLDPLTADCEEPRSNSMESLLLWNQDHMRTVNVSDFFAHHRFRRLQRLELTNCTISSWDYLISRTSALTTLDLDFTHPSHTPTPIRPRPNYSQYLPPILPFRELGFSGARSPMVVVVVANPLECNSTT